LTPEINLLTGRLNLWRNADPPLAPQRSEMLWFFKAFGDAGGLVTRGPCDVPDHTRFGGQHRIGRPATGNDFLRGLANANAAGVTRAQGAVALFGGAAAAASSMDRGRERRELHTTRRCTEISAFHNTGQNGTIGRHRVELSADIVSHRGGYEARRRGAGALSAAQARIRERSMSRIASFVLAICLFAIGPSTNVAAANPDWPKSLTLVTASPGGVYYIYGDALAKILTEKLGIAVNPLPTQGTVHNVLLVDNGTAQIGMITMGVGLEGWNGTAAWTKGKKFRQMRALFPMYDTPFQPAALRRSGLTTFAQLERKRIGIGPRGGTSGTYIPEIVKALGISAEIINGPHEQMGTDLIAGRLDAYVSMLGVPTPTFKKVEESEPITFLSLSPEQIETLRKAMPELSATKIVAGTYRSLDKDFVTLGVYNFAIGRADLPDDLVYQLVKAAFENQARLIKIHPAARETLPQNADKNTFLPFHPGAVRYYREIGIKIPDALVPTN
jgi:TRAP transporter TAXI family solute receptor